MSQRDLDKLVSLLGEIEALTSATAKQANFWPYSIYAIALALLGGPKVAGAMPAQFESSQDAHDLILHGLRGSAMAHLIESSKLENSKLYSVLGVSERSVARRKAEPRKLLGVEESSRLWSYAEALAQAIRVFGSKEAAEAWMNQPAIGLGKETPIDLLRTPPGARMVSEHLTRLEYGVYT